MTIRPSKLQPRLLGFITAGSPVWTFLVLARAVRRGGGEVLVLSGGLLGEEAIGQLLSEVESPVLLVGEGRQ